jgi:hypothetical protein
MGEENKDEMIDVHKKLAVDLYNAAWALVDKPDRTVDEDDEMVNTAHASAYHWSRLKGAIDDLRWRQSVPRSHNQLANVYLALKNAERALYHSNRTVETCKQYGIADFDIAAGYQTLALSYHLAGNAKERDENIRLAITAGNEIAAPGEKEFFFADLVKVPGYEQVKVD